MYYKIEEDSQDKIILKPDVNSEWIEEIINKYSWSNYTEEENRFTAYKTNLFDILEEKAEDLNNDEEFWSLLTKGQKIFYSFIAFDEEIDNGGMFQFFWNKPSHAFAFREVVEILNLDDLRDDYPDALKAFEGIAEKLDQIKDSIDAEKEGWEEEYVRVYDREATDFEEKTKAVKHIEDYIFEPGFRLLFHKAMCDFIESNRLMFVEK